MNREDDYDGLFRSAWSALSQIQNDITSEERGGRGKSDEFGLKVKRMVKQVEKLAIEYNPDWTPHDPKATK